MQRCIFLQSSIGKIIRRPTSNPSHANPCHGRVETDELYSHQLESGQPLETTGTMQGYIVCGGTFVNTNLIILLERLEIVRNQIWKGIEAWRELPRRAASFLPQRQRYPANELTPIPIHITGGEEAIRLRVRLRDCAAIHESLPRRVGECGHQRHL
jgi:hypothetical protein